MKTQLTKYELLVYWNCSRGYSVLTTGTTNQIIKWRQLNGCEDDSNIRGQYGHNAYTVCLPIN